MSDMARIYEVCLDSNVFSDATESDLKRIALHIKSKGEAARLVLSPKVAAEALDGTKPECIRKRIEKIKLLHDWTGRGFRFCKDAGDSFKLEKSLRSAQAICEDVATTKEIVVRLHGAAKSYSDSDLVSKFSSVYSPRKDKDRLKTRIGELSASFSETFTSDDDLKPSHRNVRESYDQLIAPGMLWKTLNGEYRWIVHRLAEKYLSSPEGISRKRNRRLLMYSAYFLRNMLADNARYAFEYLRGTECAVSAVHPLLRAHENDAYDAAIFATYSCSTHIVSSDTQLRTVGQWIIDEFYGRGNLTSPKFLTLNEFISKI